MKVQLGRIDEPIEGRECPTLAWNRSHGIKQRQRRLLCDMVLYVSRKLQTAYKASFQTTRSKEPLLTKSSAVTDLLVKDYLASIIDHQNHPSSETKVEKVREGPNATN